MASRYTANRRPSEMPQVTLPFGARSVGHAQLEKGWRHGSGNITWTNIYWGIEGRGGPTVDGMPTEVPPGYIYLHLPGTRITGYPIPEDWEYRWFTIDGPEAGAVIRSFGLVGPWPRYAGHCPVELFRELENEIKDVSPGGEYRASVTAYEILTRAAIGVNTGETPDEEARLALAGKNIIDERYGDAMLTIQGVAGEVGIHRSRFTRIFSANVGICPSSYLQRIRIRKAMTLLYDQRLSIKEIAFATGFSDPAYFSRCVKQVAGTSPRALRQGL